MASYAPSPAGKFSGRVPPGPGARDTVVPNRNPRPVPTRNPNPNPGRAVFTGPGRSTSRGIPVNRPQTGLAQPARNPGQMTPNLLAQMARRRLGG